MTDRPADQSRPQPVVGRLAVGVATGVVLALLMSYVPIVSFVAIGALTLASWFMLARRQTDARSASLAGIVLGSGLVLLYGAVTSVAACAQTDTFCGNANVTPLLAFALAVAGSGLFASVVVLRRARH